jgi:hypothetical protein
MSAPSALNAERPLLHLVQKGDTLSALVEKIDHAIDGEAHPPRPVPVLRGTTEEFEDWASEGATLIRHTTPHGAHTVRNIPTRLLTLGVRAAFYSLFAAIEVAETTQIAPAV